MTPFDWAKQPLLKYSDFSGRATRPEYWWYVLANMIVVVIASTIDSVLGLNTMLFGVYGPLTIMVGVGLLSPSLAVAVRRLHDTNRSGWWMLLALVPLAGLVVIYFLVLPGTADTNDFGAPSPSEPDAAASV